MTPTYQTIKWFHYIRCLKTKANLRCLSYNCGDCILSYMLKICKKHFHFCIFFQQTPYCSSLVILSLSFSVVKSKYQGYSIEIILLFLHIIPPKYE